MYEGTIIWEQSSDAWFPCVIPASIYFNPYVAIHSGAMIELFLRSVTL